MQNKTAAQMHKGSLPKRYFTSKPPTYDNGGLFLGFKVPAAQTFTNFSPPSDLNAYLNAISGLSGFEQRQLLQSKSGTEVLGQAASGKLSDNTSFLGIQTFPSKASCQTDSDCGSNQVCYTFNELTFGPQQGPTCTNTVYPEIMLGNEYNNGKPLRQESNFCYTDQDCKGIDKWTGKPKVGMSCNHYYKGPSIYSDNGLCQVNYESNGRRFYLNTPPGWVFPLNQKLTTCKSQADCGLTGINGWTRCVGGSEDGDKYCVWPGQTGTPSPKSLMGVTPRGIRNTEPAPMVSMPNERQTEVLNLQAAMANRPNFQTPGGGLTNTSRKPIKNANSLISMSNSSQSIETFGDLPGFNGKNAFK